MQKISLKCVISDAVSFIESVDYEWVRGNCDDLAVIGQNEIYALYDGGFKVEFSFADRAVVYVSFEVTGVLNKCGRLQFVEDMQILEMSLLDVAAQLSKITDKELVQKSEWSYMLHDNIELCFDDDSLESIFVLNL